MDQEIRRGLRVSYPVIRPEATFTLEIVATCACGRVIVASGEERDGVELRDTAGGLMTHFVRHSDNRLCAIEDANRLVRILDALGFRSTAR